MRVNGLYGHVRSNDVRSLVLFAGFVAAFHMLAALALLVPLAMLDPAHAPLYGWSGYLVRWMPVITVVGALLFAVQMAWHVRTVRLKTDFRFVDDHDEPRLCRIVEPLAIAAGLPPPYIGVINSPALNAFACGIRQKDAVLVFTRGLIDGLDDDELAAVAAHEIIHIKNGDIRLIAAANVFMRGLTLLDRVNVFKPRRYRQIAILLFAPILFPIYLGVALLSQLGMRLGYASSLLISSAREFIADAEAARLTQNPAALVSALQNIDGNSVIAGLPAEQDAMMIAGAAQGVLATHPPIAERIEAVVAVTGAMALDARPGRDTRSDFQRTQFGKRSGGAAREAWTPNEARKLTRIAATAAASKQSGLKAFLRVGESGELGIFGLRWDMAAAMLATFCTAAIIHHGDLLGFMSKMGNALNRPDAHSQALIDKALGCRNAQLKQMIAPADVNAVEEACAPSPEFIGHAAAKGVHLLGDGRVLSDKQIAMLSPDEIREANATPFNPTPILAPKKRRPANELAPSYPLPLHEAWLRLARDDLRRYLRNQQCGVLIHAHISTETDRSVTWSITSEGEERVRFTATLEPVGAQETRVTLAVDDRQPRFQLYNGDKKDDVAEPVVFRPALRTPLRPNFVEEMSAVLEDRLFHVGRIFSEEAFLPGDGMTAGLCMNQRDRLAMRSEHFSIHDPVKFP